MKKLLLTVLFCAGCYALAQSPTPPAGWKPLQVKVCDRTTPDWSGWVLPCTFDNPTTQGSIRAVFAIYGCNAAGCNSVSDTQGNVYQLALAVPQYNGIPSWLAFNGQAGADTVNFAPGTGKYAIIAEYPCPSGACSVDDAAYASYVDAGLTPAGVEIQDNVAWAGVHRLPLDKTLHPVETHESCELLLSWVLHGQGPIVAGPDSTLRADAYGILALEDSTTTIPGYYISSFSWRYPNAWDMGNEGIKMGTCPQ